MPACLRGYKGHRDASLQEPAELPDLYSSFAKQGTELKTSTALPVGVPATRAAALPLDHMAARIARSAPPAAPR